MLTSGLAFFLLAIVAAAFGLSGYADAPLQQAAVWGVCALLGDLRRHARPPHKAPLALILDVLPAKALKRLPRESGDPVLKNHGFPLARERR